MRYFAFLSVWGKSPFGYYRVVVERKTVPRPIICFCNFFLSMESRCNSSSPRGKSSLNAKGCSRGAQARIQGGPGGPGPPFDPRFWGPKIEHFGALFYFSIIFFASLRSVYYFFNMLLFQSSNSKNFPASLYSAYYFSLRTLFLVLFSHILGY